MTPRKFHIQWVLVLIGGKFFDRTLCSWRVHRVRNQLFYYAESQTCREICLLITLLCVPLSNWLLNPWPVLGGYNGEVDHLDRRPEKIIVEVNPWEPVSGRWWMEKDNFTNILTWSFINSNSFIQCQSNVEETNLFAIFWENVRLYCRPFFWSTDRRIDLSHAKDWPRHENFFKDANILLFFFQP